MNKTVTCETLSALLGKALSVRENFFDSRHEAAFRLFNGFSEGCSDLTIDLYATTMVMNNYSTPPEEGKWLSDFAQQFFTEQLPWIRTVILKIRNGTTPEEAQGRIVYGTSPDRKIREHGVWYAIDLCMNRDASLYLDTRNLRNWALHHLHGRTVLNTFAYTGSLGIAALAGGAERVIQLDRNRTFLNLAKTSCALNGFPIHKKDFLIGDFWPKISQLKRAGARFDCVFIDPPFFSTTRKGTVDLASDSKRLINKVRPLINHDGYLVIINNALFLSGREFLETLESICTDGYVKIDSLVPVPEDFANPQQNPDTTITDPAPFNHSTKIAILSISRKKK